MELTQLMLQMARNESLTPSKAAELLNENKYSRSLVDKLARFGFDDSQRKRVAAELACLHPEVKPDSMDRKIRMWFKPDSEVFIDRVTAIELCFILGLDLEKADSFLAAVTDEGFHWRDPDEIAYIFALLNHKDIHYAASLGKKVRALMESSGAQASDDAHTALVKSALMDISGEEELFSFISASASQFGKMHNTARAHFIAMLGTLEKPETSEYEPEEEKASVKEILSYYLHRDAVTAPAGGNKLLSAQKTALKNIAAGWPEETMLSRMKNGQADVTRKVLILLFLATDGCSLADDADEDEFEDEEELTRAEMFESSCDRLNLMLRSCGFRTLDPRNMFDWMVLYAMNVEAAYETDERLEDVLSRLFSETI